MSDGSVQRTVDGVPVKIGDTVWCAHGHIATVGRCKLEKHHLGMWWERLSKEIYSTERAATLAAIANQKKALGKARQEARRAAKAIERLTAKLATGAGHSAGHSPDPPPASDPADANSSSCAKGDSNPHGVTH